MGPLDAQHPGMDGSGPRIEQHRFARSHIGFHAEPGGLQRHRLGRDHELAAVIRLAIPEAQGSNAVLISKRNQAESRDHGHGCIGALAPPMNPLDG